MPASNEYYVNSTNGTNNYQQHDSERSPSTFQYEQQIEEERLRDDILRYLVKNSNGAFHFSSELRTLTRDVVGLNFKATREEFEQTESSLLDLLYSDPQRRFAVIGEGDQIFIKRAALDKDEISNLVEDWRCLIADFLLESKRVVCLSDIGSSVPRPVRIPSSVKLIFIMKTDPLNRFILQGDGNAAKVKYNMHTDPDQESLWIAKWKDDIASLLNRSQWSGQSIGIKEIEAHIARPFFLHPDVELLDVLARDPFQRFIIIGVGIDTHVTIRNFRGDEPEIIEFVELWRLLIADYLISKSAIQGVTGPHPLLGLGLSQVGAYVPRPPGVPTTVKLVDVMRGDPINRFIMSGEGNALRAMMVNSLHEGRMCEENMHYQNMDRDIKEFGRSFQNDVSANISNVNHDIQELTMGQKQHQILDAHSEWKARLGNVGNRNQNSSNQNHGIKKPYLDQARSYDVQGGYGTHGGNTTRQFNVDICRENKDHRRPHSNPSSPPRMISGAPNLDQYQNFEDRDERHYRSSYQSQQSQSNQSPHLSPLQQLNMLSGSNRNRYTEGECFIEETPLDWSSLSQKEYITEYITDMEPDQLRHSMSLASSHSPLQVHRDAEIDDGNTDGFSLKTDSNDDKSSISLRGRPLLDDSGDSSGLRERFSTFSGSICGTDRDNSSNHSLLTNGSNKNLSEYVSSNTSDSGRLGSMFSRSGIIDNISPMQLNSNSYVNHQNELNMCDSKGISTIQSDDGDQFSSTSIPFDKWMIKAWLPIAFNGFDYDLIDIFVAKLRDDGGFVTLQDLLDAQSKGELTREMLSEIAGFKVGHCNRFEKALAAYK